MAAAVVLDVTDLTREVNGVALVADVTFRLHRGEVLALVGPSGAGKTTLLRLLNRLDEPTRGRVTVHGEDHRAMPPRALRHAVGYVSQEGALFPGTVSENVTLGPRLRGERVPRDVVDDALAAFGLTDFADRDASRVSRGQAQRVALARALVNAPVALLLDEPTANLDAESTRRVEDTLCARVRDAGLACVWVTHDPAQAARVADRVLHLENGRVTREEAAPS